MHEYGHCRLLSCGALLVLCMTITSCGESSGSDSREKALVRDYLQQLMIDRQWQDWDRYFAPNATYNGTSLARAVFEGQADGLHAAFPDLELTVVDQIADGDQVASRVTLRGTHTGTLNNLTPTDAEVSIQAIVMDRIDNGRVVESWHQLDLWGAFQQIAARQGASKQGER